MRCTTGVALLPLFATVTCARAVLEANSLGDRPQYDPAFVDPTTLRGKILYGYQGWFRKPNETRHNNIHWGGNWRGVTPQNVRMETWPDVSEFPDECLFDTGLTMPDGHPARLYSSICEGVVDAHFRWMRDYSIDGVFVQRFLRHIDLDDFTELLKLIRHKAEKYGRVFAVEYDLNLGDKGKILGDGSENLSEYLLSDWRNLRRMGIASSPAYVRHRGRPALAFWGVGVVRGVSARAATRTLRAFRDIAYTIIGVGSDWREHVYSGSGYAESFRAADCIMPWAVGAYNQSSFPEWFAEVVKHDRDLVEFWGADYAPVIFPGSSDSRQGLRNNAPRNQGEFYELQAFMHIQELPLFMFSAMWDEFDEGTNAVAFARKDESPIDGPWEFTALDEEGYVGPDRNFYLELGGAFTASLRRAWTLL